MHLSYGHRKEKGIATSATSGNLFSLGEQDDQRTFISPPKKIHVRKHRAIGQFWHTSEVHSLMILDKTKRTILHGWL